MNLNGTTRKQVFGLLAGALLLAVFQRGVAAAGNVLQRPVAVAREGQDLMVAIRDSGTLARIRLRTAAGPLRQVRVSESLDDLLLLDRLQLLVGVSTSTHEAVVVDCSGPDDRVTQRIAVSKFPVSLALSPDGDRITIASQWSRRVTVLDVHDQTREVAVSGTVDLPFVPLKQLFLDQHHLLVADAHGGGLAVVNTVAPRLHSWQTLPGHNIRGLTLTPDGSQVVLTHQILNVAASTTRSIIAWGGVISNTLHTIPVAELLRSAATETPDRIHGTLFPLGRERRGAGDPGDVVITGDGRVIVALTGVHEIAVRSPGSHELTRVAVGRRPTRLLLDEAAGRLIVVCTSECTVETLDLATLERRAVCDLGASAVRSFEERGEELFYEARLSLDGWYSCHSCHSDGHSSGLLNDNQGDESFNTPKKILTLLGCGDTEPWAWNGSQTDLRNQVRKSIEFTMAGPSAAGPVVGDREVEALTAFISSLKPAPGLSVARGRVMDLRQRIERGRQVFQASQCDGCHSPPRYSSPLSFDVGMQDEAGRRYFNPPSLLGVSQRAPYFHDGRAATLQEVLLDHDHDGASSLNESDRADLIEFLQSL